MSNGNRTGVQGCSANNNSSHGWTTHEGETRCVGCGEYETDVLEPEPDSGLQPTVLDALHTRWLSLHSPSDFNWRTGMIAVLNALHIDPDQPLNEYLADRT
jgi:hypothetical protein